MAGESKGDLYRTYAEMCFRTAHSATDVAERMRWLAMGQHWVELADKLYDAELND